MILAAASIAVAVVLLDLTLVAVLLPTIRLDLGSSSSGAAWVLGAYLLAFAALVPVVARLPRGRELAMAGGVAMAVGAVLSAAAGSTAELVLGRAVAGAGAAAIVGSLAAAAPRVGRSALALPALALALGPLAGGVFAELNWWHVYFWAGVPLAAVAALPAVMADRPRATAGHLLAPLGIAAGLAAVTIGLIQAESWSWWWPVLLVLAGVALARPPAPAPPAATAAVVGAALAALAFLMPEYFELVRRLSGLRSGILLLALTLPTVVVWAVTRVVRGRVLTIAGLGCAGLGLATLATLEADTAYALQLAGLCLVGTGLGAVAGASRAEAPADGLLAWGFAGATLGLATAFEAFQQAQANERSGGASFEEALSRGVGWAAIVLLVWVAILGAWLWRARPASSSARPAAASSPPPRHPA